MNRDDVIATLNDLIATSNDGEEGFRTCADNVKNATLKTFFLEKAERCREGAAQLQSIVREMGGDPERGGSTTGALHRFWLDIRGTISGLDDHAILAECERGEDVAKREYEKALQQDLPGDVRRVIERQFREVVTNHNRIKELRDITASA
jgi:uncharacterized protein (TIGR02284 family)